MEQVHADRLREIIRWAVRDYRRDLTLETRVHWNQGTWGSGAPSGHEVTAPRACQTRDGGLFVNPAPEQFIKVTCPSACCIAGDAALMAGATFVVDCDDLADLVGEDAEVEAVEALLDGKVRHIGAIGEEWLGLNHGEAEHLFNGANEIRDVVTIARSIAEFYGFDLDPDHEWDEYLRGFIPHALTESGYSVPAPV